MSATTVQNCFEESNLSFAISLMKSDHYDPVLEDTYCQAGQFFGLFTGPMSNYMAHDFCNLVSRAHDYFGDELKSYSEELTNKLKKSFKTRTCAIFVLSDTSLVLLFGPVKLMIVSHNKLITVFEGTDVPKVKVTSRDPTDHFIVLANDNLWSAFTPIQVCDYISHQLTICSDLGEICERLVTRCKKTGVIGDVTVILILCALKPAVLSEAQILHEKYKSVVDECARDLKKSCASIDFNTFSATLNGLSVVKEYLPGLGLSKEELSALYARH